MVKITYIEASGTEHTVEVKVGWSVMEGAVKNKVPGIDAECGGNCACGTCRVYVHEGWQAKTGVPAELEQAMLDFAEDGDPRHRLSCQMKVSQALDGLVVSMPKSQRAIGT